MAQQLDVLIVDDSPPVSIVLNRLMAREGMSTQVVETLKEARAVLRETAPTVAVIDLGLPDGNGMDLVHEIVAGEIPTYPIVLTAQGSLSIAVDAMKAGARDFLVKPPDHTRFLVTVRNGIETRRLQNDVAELTRVLGGDRFYGFIGSSPAMQAIYQTINAAAASKATVFVSGESGTGKELTAEALHLQSRRCHQPFIALNCGAIPRDLIESEIFGHVKGAFTGATTDRQGAAAQAHRGTLFLDEVCEMDLDLQVKLLRFIQTGSLQKVGGTNIETVDVRFICATNRDPWEEVQAGRFREDLYYRLHVIPIHLPPLRERNADGLAIAEHFLHEFSAEEGKQFTGFDDAVAQVILNYDWPGNVRQMQNVIRNIVVLNNGPVVTPAMLPPPLNTFNRTANMMRSLVVSATATIEPNGLAGQDVRPLWMVERDAIAAAISRCDGNIKQAARLLVISPSTIYRKLAVPRDAARNGSSQLL